MANIPMSSMMYARSRPVFSAFAFVIACSASSAAFAQCAAPVQNGTPLFNQASLAAPACASAAALSGAIGNVNTAFLSQQGSAFVSAPANPSPDQPGGGIWSRAIGGEVNLKTTSNSASTNVRNDTGAVVNTSTTACNNSSHDSFGGVQVGSDISRLNWDGWNLHLGTTAGYLGSKSSDSFGFNNTFQIPFFGTYLVATKGRFFADILVRNEFYNITLNNPGLTYFNQPVSAHGYSISTSAGYNFDLGNSWFIEPSAGFIYSKTSVDNFTNAGLNSPAIPGTISTNDIMSEIGRASVRVGTTIATPNVVWQPFGSASVFHEFAGNVITNYTSLPNGAALVNLPGTPAGFNTPQTFTQQTSTSRVGTYGQYSLGLAAQVVNTGWLGFIRIDYRNGNNLDGYTGNAGLRYQFTPELIASVMPTKAMKAPRAFIGPTDWTGFYLGGFAGAAGGRTDIGFVGDGGTRPWVAGAIGGIQAGYNRQFSNNWVLGVEGDVGAANIHGGRVAGTATGLQVIIPGNLASSVGFSPAFYTAQDSTNWVATVTGRVGYSLGRTLFYAKGGAAFEDSSTSVNCVFGPSGVNGLGAGPVPVGTPGAKFCLNQAGANVASFNTPSYTRVGWTIGYGTEFDLGKNWSAKAEYDYSSFGRRTALASDGTTFLTDRADVSQVKIGMNYRFSGPGSVVANY